MGEPIVNRTARGARVRRVLWGCLLFSMFGLCVEIAFTGIAAWTRGSFLGHVSLLMIPVYASVYLMAGPLLGRLERAGLDRPAIRVPLTVVFIYAVEWSFGAAYGALGLSPWHYDHGWASDWSGGHSTLLYLPAWTLYAIAVVPVWRVIRAASPELDAVARRELGLGHAEATPGASSAWTDRECRLP